MCANLFFLILPYKFYKSLGGLLEQVSVCLISIYLIILVFRNDIKCNILGLENVNFEKGEKIGSGEFGKVYKYKISNTNREIVIKKTKSKCEDTKYIEGNINKYSSQILHRNIVRYFGALVKSESLCIYMEYMPGGSLKDLIDKLNKEKKWIEDSKVIKFTKQILEGLQFLQSKGIIHRDIKPGNILLDHDRETLKLADFGLSKLLRFESEITEKANTTCGTERYLAEEVIMGEDYSFPADIWSTGATIIHMILGKMPYNSAQAEVSQEFVTFRIGLKKINVPTLYTIPEIMVLFINCLLTQEQSERPSAEILLKHSIFKEE